VLQRRVGEVIMIGDDIKIEVLSIEKKEIRLRISAPEALAISHQEPRARNPAERAGKPRR